MSNQKNLLQNLDVKFKNEWAHRRTTKRTNGRKDKKLHNSTYFVYRGCNTKLPETKIIQQNACIYFSDLL